MMLDIQASLKEANSDTEDTGPVTLRQNAEARNIVTQQQIVIEALRRENRRLQEELSGYSKRIVSAAKEENTALASQLQRVQHEADVYTTKVEIERKRLSEVVEEIENVRSKVDSFQSAGRRDSPTGMEPRPPNSARAPSGAKKSGSFRRSYGQPQTARAPSTAGRDVTVMPISKVETMVKGLEKKVSGSILKADESVSANKVLKQEINELRRMRLFAKTAVDRAKQELQKKLKENKRLLKHNQQQREQKLQLIAQLEHLKRQASEEDSQHITEMKSLVKALNESMEPVSKKREESKDYTGEMRVEKEKQLQVKLAAKRWQVSKQLAMRSVLRRKSETFQNSFQLLHEMTGFKEDELDTFVDTFIEKEDENVRLYNRVCEFGSEIQKLEGDVDAYRAELRKHEERQDADGSNLDHLSSKMKDRLQSVKEKCDYYEDKTKESEQMVQRLSGPLQSILQYVGADSNVLFSIGSKVTELNICTVMGIIEQRANELVFARAAMLGLPVETSLTSARSTSKKTVLSGAKSTAYFPTESEIAGLTSLERKAEGSKRPSSGEVDGDDGSIRSLGDLSEDAEEDEVPLTTKTLRKEAKKTIRQALGKKEAR